MVPGTSRVRLIATAAQPAHRDITADSHKQDGKTVSIMPTLPHHHMSALPVSHGEFGPFINRSPDRRSRNLRRRYNGIA